MVSASIPAGGPVSDKFSQQNPLEFLHVPGVPKKTIHCLICCNVKSIKAISLK